MLNRYFILSLVIITCNPIQVSAMEIPQQRTYTTQCCNQILSQTVFAQARANAWQAQRAEAICPVCSQVLAVRDTQSAVIELEVDFPSVHYNKQAVADLISFDDAPSLNPTPVYKSANKQQFADLISFGDEQPVLNNPKYEIKPSSVEKKECRICLESIPLINFTMLPCNHNYYCNDCLQDILKNALKEKTTKAMHCPECQHQFGENYINAITHNNKNILNAIYDVMALESLKQNPEIRVCLNPNCSFKYFAPACVQPRTISCPACKEIYCSHCVQKHPQDVLCSNAENIRNANKSEEEKQTDEWTKNNTKQCPQCKMGVEWSGGCPRIDCECKHVFCYLCLENWTDTHKCPEMEKLHASVEQIAPNTYEVEFDQEITENTFYNFIAFVVSKSKKTTSIINDYKAFAIDENDETTWNNGVMIFESSESMEDFNQIIQQAAQKVK